MHNITEIMAMLDWNKSTEIQTKGRFLAKHSEDIEPFIQPLTPLYNKNVWENCAIIIAEENDEKLEPYLVELLEWLQDMNWPGAFCILERLRQYSDVTLLHRAINICVQKAENSNDMVWKKNLYMLRDNHKGPIKNQSGENQLETKYSL